MMAYEFYRHVASSEEIERIKAVFNENLISYEIDSPNTIIDESIIGKGLLPKFTIKLKEEDFQKANILLEKNIADTFDLHNDFTHFNDFTIEELLEIINKSDEWSIESVVASKRILESRGVQISDEEILALKEERNEGIRQGKQASSIVQIGYFLAIFLGLYLGTIFIVAGIAMGYYYSFGKSSDMFGQKYFVYNERSRRNGNFIFFGGIIGLILQIYLLFTLI
ncbi:MAG TPA: hypothetical protein PJ990_18325 [Saprospiraceae bacterium]|nr:hypothetical protein [Saprospiraceae bacterium]